MPATMTEAELSCAYTVAYIYREINYKGDRRRAGKADEGGRSQ